MWLKDRWMRLFILQQTIRLKQRCNISLMVYQKVISIAEKEEEVNIKKDIAKQLTACEDLSKKSKHVLHIVCNSIKVQRY